MLAAISRTGDLPKEQAISKLGLWIAQLTNAANTNKERNPERPVYHAAQKALMSIPGYAEYYRDRILAARLELDAHPENRGPLKGELMDAQIEGFGTLAHLPSVETARVLGAFLADERGLTIVPDGKEPSEREIQEARAETPNCTAAARAFTNLPLVGKPIARKQVTYEDVPAWRQWYERIKSGNATFRFEGDPTEYDLDGPAPPEKLKRLAAARERDVMRAERQQGGGGSATGANSGNGSQAAATTSGALPIGILLAACALCLAAGGYFLRRRSVASGR